MEFLSHLWECAASYSYFFFLKSNQRNEKAEKVNLLLMLVLLVAVKVMAQTIYSPPSPMAQALKRPGKAPSRA